MAPIEAFQLYTALRSHFTGTYDYFKYNGKINKNILKGYPTHRNKYHFEKLSKQKDPKGLIIANLVENDDIWITELFHESAQETWKKWKKRNESLSYEVSQELGRLETDDFDSNFKCPAGMHPPLFHEHIRRNVSLETMVILNDLIGFAGYWNKKMAGDPIWDMTYRKMKKYAKFIVYDKNKMKQILLTKFLTNQPS